MEIEFSRQILKKKSCNINLNGCGSRGCRRIPCGRTDMTTLTVFLGIFRMRLRTYLGSVWEIFSSWITQTERAALRDKAGCLYINQQDAQNSCDYTLFSIRCSTCFGLY